MQVARPGGQISNLYKWKKCELVCFGVKIWNLLFFGVGKSGISVFLVSAENDKMTNITYENWNYVIQVLMVKFATNKVIPVTDSIALVRCASGNV